MSHECGATRQGASANRLPAAPTKRYVSSSSDSQVQKYTFYFKRETSEALKKQKKENFLLIPFIFIFINPNLSPLGKSECAFYPTSFRICFSETPGRIFLNCPTILRNDSSGGYSHRHASFPYSASGVFSNDQPQPYSRLCLSRG